VVERLLPKQDVTGSSPVTRSKSSFFAKRTLFWGRNADFSKTKACFFRFFCLINQHNAIIRAIASKFLRIRACGGSHYSKLLEVAWHELWLFSLVLVNSAPSRLDTTARYAQPSEDDLAKAAETL
jgi:hypothetical protein